MHLWDGSHIPGQNVNSCHHFGKQFGTIPKLEHSHTLWPSCPSGCAETVRGPRGINDRRTNKKLVSSRSKGLDVGVKSSFLKQELFKSTKDQNKNFRENEIHMANTHIKMCSTSVGIRKILEPQWSPSAHSLKCLNCQGGYEAGRTPMLGCGRVNVHQLLWKTIWLYTRDTSVLFPGTH